MEQGLTDNTDVAKETPVKPQKCAKADNLMSCLTTNRSFKAKDIEEALPSILTSPKYQTAMKDCRNFVIKIQKKESDKFKLRQKSWRTFERQVGSVAKCA